MTVPPARPDLAWMVERTGFEGSVTLLDRASDSLGSTDPADACTRRLPASTFKIANALIALELGLVADGSTVIPWDGVVRERTETNRDLDLATAFRLSSVPHFEELARRAGSERLAAFLEKFHYGNRQVTGKSAAFWLDGELRIAPVEQLDFLAGLECGELPIAARTRSVVLDLMEQERTEEHVLRAKSGWARPPEGDVGWWVGWVERGERRVFFATCLRAPGRSAALGPAREALTRAVLRAEGLLPDPHAEEGRRLLAALFPATHSHARATSLALTPWTRHVVFDYAHFTRPHVPHGRATFDTAGTPRLVGPHGGVAQGDPVERFNALAREEELELAETAAAESYARFVLDCWFPRFEQEWNVEAEGALPRSAGPLRLPLTATATGWRLAGVVRSRKGPASRVDLDLRRDGTIALDVGAELTTPPGGRR